MPSNTIRLERPGLIGARVLWIVLALTILLYLIAGLPQLLAYYGLPCETDSVRVCAVMEAGLRSLGLDWSFFAWYSVIWIVAVCLPLFILCSLLAWRKRDDPKMLLFSIALLLGLVMNVSYSLTSVVAESNLAAKEVVFILAYLGQIGPMLCYVFPDGRFVPGWTRWMAVAFAVFLLVASFLYWLPLQPKDWLSDAVNFIAWVIFPLTLAYALLYRYRKAASPEQRQQIKWVVWTAALTSVLFVTDAMIDFAGSWSGWDTSMPTWYSVYQALFSPTIYYMRVGHKS